MRAQPSIVLAAVKVLLAALRSNLDCGKSRLVSVMFSASLVSGSDRAKLCAAARRRIHYQVPTRMGPNMPVLMSAFQIVFRA